LTSEFNIGLRFDQWVDNFLPLAGTPNVPDPVSQTAQCATYLNGLRKTLIESTGTRPLIRVADRNLDIMAQLTGEISGNAEDLMTDTGKATIEILYDNWLVDWMTNQTMPVEDLNLIIDPFPANPNWKTRWGGKIIEIHVKQDDKGIHSIQLVALHFREHAKKLLVAANPIFPPEVQLPKMWVMPGPVRTVLATTAFVNLGRLFMPIWSTIDNIFNPAGWINPLGPDAALQFLPTEWPIQVAFVDPVFDQSRWSSCGGTWTPWDETFKDLLEDSGCVMRAYTYLTTDEDSPNIELANLLTLAPELIQQLTGIDLSTFTGDLAKLAAPQRNCVVFSFEQKDGRSGPTGTAADGLLATVGVTLDDLITPVTVNLTSGETYDPGGILNGVPVQDAAGIGSTQLIQQLLDVAPEPPKVIWWDSIYGGVVNSDLTWHKGAVKTTMTGAKSPIWVNEGISFAVRYSLAQLSDVINWWLTAGGEQQVPGTPGLDNLYQGQLSDVFLAWQRYTDPIRAIYGGDVAWQEHFEKGSGTAYTLASIITLREGNWKTREFAAFKCENVPGWPWIADYDYFLGDRVGFEKQGIIYVDNVYGIKRDWNWKKPFGVLVKIGDDRQRDDPFHAAFKTMQGVYSLVGQLLGEGTVFSSSGSG
jgi:hypothetical protein